MFMSEERNANPNVLSDEIPVKAGDNMDLGQEPAVEAETTPKGEETPGKNETKAPETEPAKEEVKEGGEAERSSKLISELGEDRKQLASEMVELARGDDAAAERLKDLMSKNPKMDKLIKTKFGEDYDKIVKGESLKKDDPADNFDVDEFKKQAKLEAKAEALLEQDARLKRQQFNEFAKSYGLNSEEAEKVEEHAEILEGKYGYEEALKLSLKLVSEDKAGSKDTYEPPTGGGKTPESDGKAELPSDLQKIVKRYDPSRSPEEIAKGLKYIDENMEGNKVTFKL